MQLPSPSYIVKGIATAAGGVNINKNGKREEESGRVD